MNQICRVLSTSTRLNIYRNAFNKINNTIIINNIYNNNINTSLNNVNRYFSSNTNNTNKDDLVTFKFVNKDGSIKEVSEPVGSNILEAAHHNDVDLEGACECSCACSTCHVYLEPKVYNILPEPTDDENDMLDLAFNLKENSRLGCQIKLTKDLEGMVVTLPIASRNMTHDGYKPPKH